MNTINALIYRPVRVAAAASLLITIGLPASTAFAAPSAAAAQGGTADSASLKSAATDDATRQFYEQNGWQAVWTSAATQGLQQALANRAVHGLDQLSFFDSPGSSANAAQKEVAMTAAALKYASTLARGKADPERLHQVYTLSRPQADLAAPLANAIAQNKLSEWLASLAPQTNEYVKLSEAYGDASKEMRSGGDDGSRIAASGLIRVGDTDERVPAIAQQLQTNGYLSSGAASSNRYTQQMAEALKRMQRNYGIADDGVVGPDTVEVLNLRPADRARALAVGMERLRWLERDPPATRIDVNIAAARLRYYRDGEMVDSRKVIAGQPGNETPLLLSPVYRLVANPTWTIPKSIENEEMANVSANYLSQRNMVRRDGYIVQLSGPDNALGLVKFDMINDHAIYLHDTGSPSLFDRSERHLSHGCVRVHNALEFAEMLARDQGISAKWEEARAASDQTFVDIPNQIPVRLLYQNAHLDNSGQVAIGTDPYGWNGPVAEALGFEEGKRSQARAQEVDVGP